MKKIVFATNNAHKIEEVRAKLSSKFTILSLRDINCNDDIPETANTFIGNAEQKAIWVLDKYGHDCFADDSGIEIEALDNRPGVFSARYAGEDCSFDDNNKKVLQELEGKANRNAKFSTTICLKLKGETYFFVGEIDGKIITNYAGSKGFGYDPIFVPNGYDRSFAQMTLEEKNKISHRAIAVEKMWAFLEKLN
ncbi:MAG: RdgB/HAM1 family non-canonical purine NTP pyrophosphatase [Bacteroidales bacterium]|nr:RdgB/HAM1 family non-canonical purine NTP pyrophosphatase [Bacteroidales bacterium]